MNAAFLNAFLNRPVFVLGKESSNSSCGEAGSFGTSGIGGASVDSSSGVDACIIGSDEKFEDPAWTLEDQKRVTFLV